MSSVCKNVFSFCICAVSFAFLSCSGKSSFLLSISESYAEPVAVRSSKQLKTFYFSENQKAAAEQFFSENGDAALLVQIRHAKQKHSENGEENTLSLGFFSGTKQTSAGTTAVPVVTAALDSFGTEPFALVLCLEKGKTIPDGFFIQSSVKYTIETAQIIRACVGHDFSGTIPVFAFAPNGGSTESVDNFSGASLSFSSVNSRERLMPVIKLQLSDGQESMKIAFGGEVLNIIGSGAPIEIPTSALKYPFSSITYPDDSSVPAVLLMTAADKNLLTFAPAQKNVLTPIKTDPGLIMAWSRNNWRGNDYELFEWDRFPGILFFDTSSYAVQDAFFRRLAYYVEKAGYRGTLLSDAQLSGKHGYNAHDYRAESLADFFEKARNDDFPLNEKELLLKEILVANGILKRAPDGTISAGTGAVISISQESTPYLRATFIAHEGWHGLFFLDDEFRNATASIYYTIDQRTLAYLRKYFQVTPSLNYDVNDDYLMKNEFMAYMLQRPVSAVAKYFIDMAKREHSQKWAKTEADYIIATEAAGFASAATLLDQYVNDRWKLNAGRVWLISR